jgi:hypothetical protein
MTANQHVLFKAPNVRACMDRIRGRVLRAGETIARAAGTNILVLTVHDATVTRWRIVEEGWGDAEMLLEAPDQPQTRLGDVWRWLREGQMKRLGDNPDLRQAYLDASSDCLYLEDGETGELVLIDCQAAEGMSIHVYDGELAWALPMDGGEAVKL